MRCQKMSVAGLISIGSMLYWYKPKGKLITHNFFASSDNGIK